MMWSSPRRGKSASLRVCRTRVQDANLRTHLFRIELTPFVSLFSLCGMFLETEGSSQRAVQ
jgi:hypothetical protein